MIHELLQMKERAFIFTAVNVSCKLCVRAVRQCLPFSSEKRLMNCFCMINLLQNLAT